MTPAIPACCSALLWEIAKTAALLAVGAFVGVAAVLFVVAHP